MLQQNFQIKSGNGNLTGYARQIRIRKKCMSK